MVECIVECVVAVGVYPRVILLCRPVEGVNSRIPLPGNRSSVRVVLVVLLVVVVVYWGGGRDNQ